MNAHIEHILTFVHAPLTLNALPFTSIIETPSHQISLPSAFLFSLIHPPISNPPQVLFFTKYNEIKERRILQ